jgi:glucose-6-phosphate 1-epimerase
MTELVRIPTLPASVRVEPGVGGLPKLAIATPHGTAELYFHGAHLTAWHPAHSAPVLWMSRESRFESGSPIRGGVPICFPWFGALATDPNAPAHGYARLLEWALIDAIEPADGRVTLTMELMLPGVRAQYRVTVGPTLTLDLEVHNVGSAPFTFEEALHSYFAVQDVRQVTITGIERTDFLDKVGGFSRRTQGEEPIRFTGETDRVYLNTQATCVIHDPGLRRAIGIHKQQSDATVIWNPWIGKAKAMQDFGDDEWPEMVCVETCNVNVHARTLPAGERHTMTAVIEVGELSPR